LFENTIFIGGILLWFALIKLSILWVQKYHIHKRCYYKAEDLVAKCIFFTHWIFMLDTASILLFLFENFGMALFTLAMAIISAAINCSLYIFLELKIPTLNRN